LSDVASAVFAVHIGRDASAHGRQVYKIAQMRTEVWTKFLGKIQHSAAAFWADEFAV
jgi:hypothetical protein